MLCQGDTFSQNLFLEPPVAGTHRINVPVDAGNWQQQIEVWLTPWGFVKGAQMYGMSYTKFSWVSPESMPSPSGIRYTVNGYVNDDNLVVRAEIWVEDAFMGDMHVVGVYEELVSCRRIGRING